MNKATEDKFNSWLENANDDIDLKRELIQINRELNEARESRNNDIIKTIEDDLEDRFSCDLEFGTGGLRGIIGAGSNRMNHYTVARATQGLADFIIANNPASDHKDMSVAIGFDSRHKSLYFARVTAQVLAANGIKSYVRCIQETDIIPTPMLSFAVRRLKCNAGVMITASHNPSKYNGYKAYGSDGCQLSLNDSDAVVNRIKKLDIFKDVELMDFDDAYEKELITRIDEEVINDFFEVVKSHSIHDGICRSSGLKVVYTPLNGAGNKPVRRILSETGVENVIVVPEQELPDGNFPTCPYPNPEFGEALELGLDLSRRVGADLLLATDPDCDRVGVAVRDDGVRGGYVTLSGNEVGALMLEYICRERKANRTMPINPVAVKSIVTTQIAEKIAKKYNVELVDTLTGFKFIGAIAGELEKKGTADRFIFGFEESIGYLPGSYVRDKDAVCACMIICEMAAFYKNQGKSLVDARDEMYEEFGYYYHSTQNLQFEGKDGLNKMNSIMKKLRANRPSQIRGVEILRFTDFLSRTVVDLKNPKAEPVSTNLPSSNVLKLELADGSVIIIRPSGTEPKLKVYYTCIGETLFNSKNLQSQLEETFSSLIGI